MESVFFWLISPIKTQTAAHEMPWGRGGSASRAEPPTAGLQGSSRGVPRHRGGQCVRGVNASVMRPAQAPEPVAGVGASLGPFPELWCVLCWRSCPALHGVWRMRGQGPEEGLAAGCLPGGRGVVREALQLPLGLGTLLPVSLSVAEGPCPHL